MDQRATEKSAKKKITLHRNFTTVLNISYKNVSLCKFFLLFNPLLFREENIFTDYEL